jgi:hypothetical protein
MGIPILHKGDNILTHRFLLLRLEIPLISYDGTFLIPIISFCLPVQALQTGQLFLSPLPKGAGGLSKEKVGRKVWDVIS